MPDHLDPLSVDTTRSPALAVYELIFGIQTALINAAVADWYRFWGFDAWRDYYAPHPPGAKKPKGYYFKYVTRRRGQ